MNINIKDRNNNPINLGDEVEILKITNDSGLASDLYGVEPEMDGWTRGNDLLKELGWTQKINKINEFRQYVSLIKPEL